MCAVYNKLRHDIGITDVGSAGAGTTLYGMMLAQTQDGTPAYAEYDGKYLADQFFTGAPSQVNMNPEEELILSQSSWRAGMGLEYFDPDHPERYFASYGMDLRFKGMAIAGPLPTAITLPTHTASAYNQALNFTDPDSAWTDEANVLDGSSSTKATTSTSAKYLEIYVPAISCSKIRYYWTESVSNGVDDLEIGVWYEGAWHVIVSDDSLGEGALAEGSIGSTKTVTAARVKFTLSSGNAYLHVLEFYAESATIQGAVTSFAEYNDKLYAAFGNALIEKNSAGTAFVVTTAFPVTITDIEPFTDDQLYIALGFSDAYWEIGYETSSATLAEGLTNSETDVDTSDGSQFATGNVIKIDSEYMLVLSESGDTLEVLRGRWGSTAATHDSGAVIVTFHITENTASGTATYQFFVTVHAAAPTMYGNDGVNTLYKNTDPSEAGANAWATRITVDSSYYAITEMLSKSGAAYIMKEDMPYYLNSSDAVQNDLAPELKTDTRSTSGKNAFLWKTNIYIPFGTQGLLETDGTTNTFRNPANYCTNLPAYVGRIQALAGDGFYLFAILDYSGKVEILAGRLETIDTTTSWVWHPIAEMTMTDCETAFATNIDQKRLYVSSTTIGETLQYIDLPAGYGDVENDANRKFNTGSPYFETPFLHGGFKADNKAWIKITLAMGHTYNTGRYFTVHYKTLDGSYVSIGDFTGASGNMVQGRFIDVTNKPFSSMMALKFTAVTDDTDYTPILLSYDVRAIMYPKIKRLIHCVVRCADEVQTKQAGIIDKSMRKTIKSTLDNARNNPVWMIPIKDIDGDDVDVKFLPVPSSLQRMMITKKEKGRTDERHYHLLLMEVELA